MVVAIGTLKTNSPRNDKGHPVRCAGHRGGLYLPESVRGIKNHLHAAGILGKRAIADAVLY